MRIMNKIAQLQLLELLVLPMLVFLHQYLPEQL